MKIFKCQHCNYNIENNKLLKGERSAKYKMGEHYDVKHHDLLPNDMDGYRYFYYLLTGKSGASCIECKSPTEFNRITMKYSRFCNNPECKRKYKEMVDKRMLGKYGKVHILDDPEMQKRMLSGRRISGIYTWSDNKNEFNYVSSYELDFLMFLDNELHWEPSDLLVPSPHVYYYHYNGKPVDDGTGVKRFYIPDFFIPSLNLEVEIKDDGSALRINQDSRNKDIIKDDLMKSMSNLFNYIKIVNKDYTEFKKLIKGD